MKRLSDHQDIGRIGYRVIRISGITPDSLDTLIPCPPDILDILIPLNSR